jgi:uncharacterized protein YuzE
VDLKIDPHSGGAYLALDSAAHRRHRLRLGESYDQRAWGITLDFDGEGHLVGLAVKDAQKQLFGALLRGGAPLVELDPAEKYGMPGVGFAYLWLNPERTGRADETVVIDPDESHARGDLNLDIEPNGRLIGVEFVDARDLPAVLLESARRI